MKRSGMFEERTIRHERLEITQKDRHAARRPYRSARFPANAALTAPERKPVVKRAAITFSGSDRVCL